MSQMFDTFKEAFDKKKQKNKDKDQTATITDYTGRKAKVEKAVEKLANTIDGLDDLGGDSKGFKKSLHFVRELLPKIDAVADQDYPAAYRQLDKLKKEAYEAEKNAAKAYKAVIETPQASVQVQVNGQPMKLHPKSVPGFDELSRDQGAKALAAIGSKIENGKTLVSDLLNDPTAMKDQVPEPENVSDMMWYLKSMAEVRAGEAFIKGSLTLPDQGYAIREYLDRCPEIYNRLSSHMKDHQEKAGGSARGMDFYEGDVGFNEDGTIDEDKAKLMMPYGMNTLLIQSFTIDKTGEQRLMLKMETQSARFGGLTLAEPDELLADRADANTLPKSRPSTPEDKDRTIAHGKNAAMSVVLKKHDDGGLAAFREDLGKGKAKEVLDAYKTVLEKAKKDSPHVHGVLKAGDYKTNINVMYHNVEALASYPNFDGTDEVKALLDKFLSVAQEMEKFGNLESRVGGEVALSKGDMK